MQAQVWYFVLFVTVNTLSYYLYNPTPADMEQANLYSIGVLANLRIINDLAKISDAIGYKDYRLFKQDVIQAMSKLIVMMSTPPLGVNITSAIFDGVPVRLYRKVSDDSTSSQQKARQGALVYLHGGGFMLGSPESYEVFLSRLAADAGILVVGVDYRLAPQHPSPAALEDCMKAARYVFVEADSLGVNPAQVGVAGDSAGGNLAASLTLGFRDIQGAPKFAYMINIYPWLQAVDFNTPSVQQNERFVIPELTRQGLATFALSYVNASLSHMEALISNRHIRPVSIAHFGQHIRPSILPRELVGEDYQPPKVEYINEEGLLEMEAAIMDPLNFPLMMDSLKGLPPTFIATMGYDTIRDDGFWFAEHLKKDGIGVQHYHDPVGWHCLLNVMGSPLPFDAADRLYNKVLDFVKFFS